MFISTFLLHLIKVIYVSISRLRQDEMTLIAHHKYGVRVTTDSKWKEFVAHLGESAAAFELLQAKSSSAVKINFDCSSVGSSKGNYCLTNKNY